MLPNHSVTFLSEFKHNFSLTPKTARHLGCNLTNSAWVVLNESAKHPQDVQSFQTGPIQLGSYFFSELFLVHH